MEKVITVKEAADLTGKKPSTIRRWCAAGLLKKARKTDAGYLVDRDEVVKYASVERRGFPRGAKRCPHCGAMAGPDHKCDMEKVRARLEREAARRQRWKDKNDG